MVKPYEKRLLPVFKTEGAERKQVGWLFWCPGCRSAHRFDERWDFNGDTENPTFSPSLKNTWTEGPDKIPKCCHLHLHDGVLKFCPDCTHELAGQSVPLPRMPV